MSVLNWLFGNNKKKETKKEAIINKQNINRVPKYTSYHDDYERVKRKDNSSSIIEDVVIGMAVNSVVDSFLSNNDSIPNYSSYDSNNSSSGFSSGFGGGDYSGGGSSSDWGSSSDSSSSDSYSSND